MRKMGLAGLLVCAATSFAAEPADDPLTMVATQERDAAAPHVDVPSNKIADDRLEISIQKGLRYLEQWQHDNGSWDRIENPPPMQLRPPNLEEPSDYDGPVKDLGETDTEEVADTCLSAAAMFEAIETGRVSRLSKNCLKAIDYVCADVALWSAGTIYIQKRTLDPLHDDAPAVNDVRFYDATVDTFFALRFLSEVKDKITDPARKDRVERTIQVLVGKIEGAQDIQGTWWDDANPLSVLRKNPATAKKLEMPKEVKVGAYKFRVLQEAPQYDQSRLNIMTHLAAMDAINIAVQHGVRIGEEVRAKGNVYMAADLRDQKWPAKHRRVLIAAIVASLYENDQAWQALLAQGRSRLAAGKPIGEIPLKVLETQAARARADLRPWVDRFMGESQVYYGPALDALPDVIKAIALVRSKEETDSFKLKVREQMYDRQFEDGHFIADNIDPADPETRKHPERRGDNVFGTAATLRVMMATAK